MRKLYALIAGLFLALAGTNISAQPNGPDLANFTFNIHPGNNVSFTNTSVLAAGTIVGERRAWWYFGDGTSQSGPALGNMQHHYNATGTYTVCLKIYRYHNNDSVLTGSVCKTVVLQENTCAADFTWRDSIVQGPPPTHLVRFTATTTSSQNRPIVSVCWNFGDGTPIQCIQATSTTPPATLLQAQHTFSGPGPYNVCVRIQYDGGCVAEKCRIIELHQIPPPDSCRANFERINVSATSHPLSATFKAIPWHNNNKKPVRICWEFGDGQDTCIQYSNSFQGPYTVNHTYASMGQYQVCVKILYQGGCEARKCESVRIGRPDSCTANFERIQSTTANPLNAYFKALPWHNNGKKPSRICWQFGDGTDTCINYLNIHTGPYVVGHNYAQPGNYQVCVKITYFGGCESTKCNNIRVGHQDSCRADFERIPVTVNNPLTAGFRALPWHNNNKKPVRICWQFGDGQDTCIQYPATSTGPYTVNHTYAHPGTYQVCVKILYEGGCEATKCSSITIPPLPVTCSVTLFEITPSITSRTRAFYAVPISTPTRRPELVCWYFGDGTDTCITIQPGSPIPNLTIQHTYPGPGVYRPCVTVRFEGGCTATSCREVIIRPSTNICGGYMTDSLVGPKTIKFKGFSIHAPNDQVLSYRWTFGDGSSALGQEVTHTYNVAGTYNVCLIIRTALGCETHICRPVRVPGTHVPQLIITPNPVLNELHAIFQSTHTEPVTIRIANNFGNTVQTYTRNAVIGTNTWNFNVSNLMPGIYSFIVQSPNQLASALFIKL